MTQYRAHREPMGWSTRAWNRDQRVWPYAVLLTDQFGRRMSESVHGSESSARMEVEVCAKRIRDGKPNRGGQIPTSIDVGGISEGEWHRWRDRIMKATTS